MEGPLADAPPLVLSLVALLGVIEFLRYRDRPRLDAALMLVALGIPVLVNRLPPPISDIWWLSTVSTMLLLAQPYLLLRLVEDFRPVPRLVMIAGLTGMVLAWAAIMTSEAPRSAALVVGLVSYFLLFEGYAVVAFALAARTTRGVSKWRYGLAALGSLMLAAAILVAGAGQAVPAFQETAVLINLVFPVLVAVGYYLAFIPPRWLRQAWQLPEVRRFLQQAAGQPARERGEGLLRDLCTAATQAAGGVASAVFLWDDPQQQFRAVSSDHPELESAVFGVGEAPLLTGVWREGTSTFARNVDGIGPACARLGRTVGANAFLVVPIATPYRTWGILIVFELRGTLFPSDDLALLEILAEQCAIALDNAELVAEQERRAEEARQLASQLEVSNQELEAFAYSVSHDLRAPLRGIDGFSLALLEDYRDQLDDRAVHYIQRVRAGSQLMGRLIDDLLKLSRVSRSELTIRQVDLTRVANDIAEGLRRQDPERGVQFKIGKGLKERGDPGLLRIMLENLMGNAWKFTSRHPSATIEFGVNSDGETKTYFVRDDGVGFDMEYADKLFGPFQRLHGSEGFDGTGVGLATVQRVIRRHGGRVWAEGAVGKGATFYFTLDQGIKHE